MTEHIEDLARRLVIGKKRDGRSVYDEEVKAQLVAESCKPGVSKSLLARQVGVNANQLSRWIKERERDGRRKPAAKMLAVSPPAFVPVTIESEGAALESRSMALRAQLPNGVVVDLIDGDVRQFVAVINALGGLRCSASTKG
jgi:transposase